MSAPIPVALLGFSNFERNALASYFRLAPRSTPTYVHVLDVDDARFVVADADQPGVPELLDALGRVGDAVFIGANGPDDAAAWMMRPIDPAQVLRELDNLLTQRDNPATGAGPLPMSTRSNAMARVAASATLGTVGTMSRRAADDRPATALDGAARKADAAARRDRRLASLRPVTVRRALLVDDSEVALAFLERQLVRMGVAADWAMNSAKALELMAQRNYGFVFLDVDLGDKSDMDGLSLCQHIKRRHAHADGRAPLVVLVSAFNEAVDRVRGTLAGADEQLGKPLDVDALERLLLAHGIDRPATI